MMTLGGIMKRLILVFLLATAVDAARLTPTDRYRLVNVTDPQISPDGRSIVCVVARANVKDDRWDSDLMLVDVATGAQQALTYERRGLASPRWSPDGQRIAFLANATADREAKRQIWIMPLRVGEARRITDAARGVQQFAWSPDGSQIAFVTSDEAMPNEDKNNRSFEVQDDDY